MTLRKHQNIDLQKLHSIQETLDQELLDMKFGLYKHLSNILKRMLDHC